MGTELFLAMPQFLNLEKRRQSCPPPVGFRTQGLGYSRNATVPYPMPCKLLREHCSVPGAQGCPSRFGNPKGKHSPHCGHQDTLNPLLGQGSRGMNHFCVNRRCGEEDRQPASLEVRGEQLAGRGPGAAETESQHHRPHALMMPGPQPAFWKPSRHRDAQAAGPVVQVSDAARCSTPGRHTYN